ncbi:MAG: hypothetical protein WCK65_09485 [Rhodospirillaceae bacterium]
MAMLMDTLFGIIRQEQRQLEDEIAAEERKRPTPDLARLSFLRTEQTSLRRELELYAER